MTFAAYLGSAFEGLSKEMLAVSLILSLTVLHGVTRSLSGGTQVVFTALKVALVLGFSAAALTVGETVLSISLLAKQRSLILAAARSRCHSFM